jgi:hypothetical protein
MNTHILISKEVWDDWHVLGEYSACEHTEVDLSFHNENIDTIIKSCEQGRDGDWDCTTDEGKEGFDDMIELLEKCKL